MMDVDSVPWRSKEVENTNHENTERIRNTRLADADGNGDEDEDVNLDKPGIKEDQPPAPSTVPVDPNTEAVTHLVALIKRIQDQAHAQEYEQEYEHLHSHPHWLEMSNVEQKDWTTKSTRSAASVSTAIPISPINLPLDDTPRAVLYSNTNPSAQIWAWNLRKVVRSCRIVGHLKHYNVDCESLSFPFSFPRSPFPLLLPSSPKHNY